MPESQQNLRQSYLQSTLNDETTATNVDQPKEEFEVEEPHDSYLDGLKLLLVMLGVTVVLFLSMLDIAIIGTAIPKITSDFHTLNDVGWYVGAYQLASATIQPLTGKMFTYFTLKWSYLACVIVFEIGSVLCGSAQSSTMFVIGRAVAGLGSSGLVNGSITIVAASCKPAVRPLYTGFAMGIGQLGVVMGPLLGGALTEHASWRWCFYINLPLGGLAAIVIILISIPEQIPKSPITRAFLHSLLPKFDLTGFALFAPASIMLLLALQFGSGEYGWNSSEVIGLFCGAGATTIVFLLWEWRVGEEAMIPLAMFGKRVVWCSSVSLGFLVITVIGGSNFMPLYLQSVQGLSPTMSGVYMLASICSQLVFILLSGALVTRFGYYIPWALFAAATSSIACGLISIWGPETGLGKLIGYQIIFGGRGAGIQMAMIAIQYALPAKDLAIGNSILVLTQTYLSAVFVTLGNTIFQETLKAEIRANVPGISPEAAVAAGGSAEAVRALAPPGPVRDAILEAYSAGVNNIFYMLAGLAAIAFFLSFGMGWVDLRTQKDPLKATEKRRSLHERVRSIHDEAYGSERRSWQRVDG